jgi:hypothetical protein
MYEAYYYGPYNVLYEMWRLIVGPHYQCEAETRHDVVVVETKVIIPVQNKEQIYYKSNRDIRNTKQMLPVLLTDLHLKPDGINNTQISYAGNFKVKGNNRRLTRICLFIYLFNLFTYS